MIPAHYKIYQNIAFNLLNMRKSKNLDQKKFAELCGLSRPTYLRAERGHQILTLRTLVKISLNLRIHIIDLFKEPFDEVVRADSRQKTQVATKDGNGIAEEKYLSRINPLTQIKRIHFKPKQRRKMKLVARGTLEIIVVRGKVIVSCTPEFKTLKSGEQFSLSYNPQLSHYKRDSECISLRSEHGAEILLIQTLVH